MKNQNLLIVLCLVFCMSACSRKTSTTTGGNTTYSEDLSVLHPYIPITEEEAADAINVVERPVEAVITQLDINEELDSISGLITERNLQRKFIDGFTVQVYSGSNRDAANKAYSDLQLMALDVTPQLVYIQPTYRVKVGKFYSRLEANGVYAQIKEVFPDALLLPEKIAIE